MIGLALDRGCFWDSCLDTRKLRNNCKIRFRQICAQICTKINDNYTTITQHEGNTHKLHSGTCLCMFACFEHFLRNYPGAALSCSGIKTTHAIFLATCAIFSTACVYAQRFEPFVTWFMRYVKYMCAILNYLCALFRSRTSVT